MLRHAVRRALLRHAPTKEAAKVITRRRWQAQVDRRQRDLDLHHQLEENYAHHHQAMLKILDNADNRKALFGDVLDHPFGSISGEDYTYHNDIRYTVEMLVTWYITTLVCDVNVQAIILGNVKDDGLYRDVMAHLKLPQLKHDIRQELSSMSRDNITTQDLVDQFASSEYFNSLQTYRSYFTHFKLAQALNYDDSDHRGPRQCRHGIYFSLPQLDNREYLARLQKAFATFSGSMERQKVMEANNKAYREYCASPTAAKFAELDEIYQAYAQAHPKNHQHLSLLAEVIRILVECHQYTPTPELFTYLIDTFDEHNMKNYATMAYQCLFSYSDNASVLAASTDECQLFSQVSARHFLPIITASPDCLGSLIGYCARRQQKLTFRQLLLFFGLDEVMAHESVLDKSYLSPVIAKLRFLRYKEYRKLDMDLILFKHAEPLAVKPQTIVEAMKACVEMKEFGFVDSLFNKMVMHMTNLGKVALAFGESHKLESDLILLKKYSVSELSRRYFTQAIIEVMITAAVASNDLGRLMWLMPHVDDYIERGLVGISSDNVFASHDRLDPKLVAQLREALLHFGLEGKLHRYRQLFAQLK